MKTLIRGVIFGSANKLADERMGKKMGTVYARDIK
jgi:hypothetical protein